MVRGAEVTELRGELDLLGLRVGVFQQVELAMKRLQLMKELLPSVEAATVFWNANSFEQWQAAQRASQSAWTSPCRN